MSASDPIPHELAPAMVRERDTEQGVGVRRGGVKLALQIAGVTAAALLLANCAGQVEREGAKQDRFNKKYGVSSSPRVVKDGQPVPKGGGRAMVGKTYTIAGKRYTPVVDPNYSARGVASWYGPNFHGRLTANGEVFDKYSIAAAHPTLPLPSYVRVTNLDNGLSLVVRVNDRGPYHGRRLIDVSRRAAELLEFRHMGTARVKVDYLRMASLNGSDDTILERTLTAGAPAQLDGGQSPVMVASAEGGRGHAAQTSAHGARDAGESAHHDTAAQVASNNVAANHVAVNHVAANNGAARHDAGDVGPHAQSRQSTDGEAKHVAGGEEGDHGQSEGVRLVSLPKVAPLPPVRPIIVASGH